MLAVDFEERLLALDWQHRREAGVSIPATFIQFVAAWRKGGPAPNLEYAVLPRSCLCEGTYLSIPFRHELVEARVGAEKVYDLLSLIAICTDQYWADEAAEPGDRELIARCRAGLEAGLDLYLGDLTEAALSIEARSAILTILSLLPQARPEWLPIVTRLRETEPSALLAAEIDELIA